MEKHQRNFIFIVCILVFISLACNLPFSKSDSEDGENQVQYQVVTAEGPTQENEIIEQKPPDPKPVSFQEGFGSLDSYKFKVKIETTSSDGSLSIVEEMVESSVIDENNHSVTTNTSREAGDPEVSTDTSETYNIGTITCSYSGDEWEYSEKSIQEKELTDIFSQMIDFVPIISDPVFIGEENINGTQTNHFQFSVPGIGDKSGAVATINQGDYYLAIDGQYLVRYTLNLQIQSAPEDNPEAEISNMLVSYDLYDVNVPISLVKPAECVPTEDD